MIQDEDSIKGLRIFKKALRIILISTVLAAPLKYSDIKKYATSGEADFIIFYTGARILGAHMGARLYDYNTQKIFQDDLKLALPFNEGILLFNHAPFELLAFLPLIHLQFPAAHFVWFLLNIGFLAGIFLLLLPYIDRQCRFLSALLLLGFFPVLIVLLQGQDSILSTLLLAATFTSLKYGHDGLAGVLLSIGLFKPQLVLPLLVVLLFKRRWRAVVGFLAGSAGLALISLSLVRWRGLLQWVQLLREMNRQRYTMTPEMMPNVRGFVETLAASFSGWWPSLLVSAASAILLLGLLARWRDKYQPDDTPFELKFSFCMVITVLISYHLYAHDLTVLVLPAILTSNYVLKGAMRVRTARNLFCCSMVVLSFPLLYFWLLNTKRLYWLFPVILAVAVALALEIPHAQFPRTESPPR